MLRLNSNFIRSSLISVGCKTLLTLVSLPLWGAAVPCAQTTLASYISLSEGCTVDGLVFSDFAFTTSAATSNPGSNDIVISPLSSTGPADWTGIRISNVSGGFLLMGEQLSMDFAISFNVSSTPPYFLNTAFLLSDAYANGSGSHAKVKELIDYGPDTVEMHSNEGKNGPLTIAFPAAALIQVTKRFNLDTGPHEGGSASIGFVDQRFAIDTGQEPVHAPEPATIILAGCGLLAVVFCRRRK